MDNNVTASALDISRAQKVVTIDVDRTPTNLTALVSCLLYKHAAKKCKRLKLVVHHLFTVKAQDPTVLF